MKTHYACQSKVSLLGCLKLLAAFKNWGLIEHRYWWAEKWVDHKPVLVANRAQMGHGVQKSCAYGCESVTQCKVFNLKKILGGDEHLGLCFPVQITVTERELAVWICIQPSRWVFVVQHSEIWYDQSRVAIVSFCQSQYVSSVYALLMWASWPDVLNFLVCQDLVSVHWVVATWSYIEV